MSGSIAIAILAAGKASRFGGAKLDARCAGKPVGQWVIEAVAAAGLSPGMIIVGPHPPDFAQAAMANGWSLITNARPEDGMGGSVALAAAHADCLRAEAMVLLLADMPVVGADHIVRLAMHQPTIQPVATLYPQGHPGVPARFPASMFDDLLDLQGDKGAAGLLRDRTDSHIVACSPSLLIDVDTPEALDRAETCLRPRNPLR